MSILNGGQLWSVTLIFLWQRLTLYWGVLGHTQWTNNTKKQWEVKISKSYTTWVTCAQSCSRSRSRDRLNHVFGTAQSLPLSATYTILDPRAQVRSRSHSQDRPNHVFGTAQGSFLSTPRTSLLGTPELHARSATNHSFGKFGIQKWGYIHGHVDGSLLSFANCGVTKRNWSTLEKKILHNRRAGKLSGDTTSALKARWQSHSKWPYPTVSDDDTSYMYHLFCHYYEILMSVHRSPINLRNRNSDTHVRPHGRIYITSGFFATFTHCKMNHFRNC